jgi:hypothetical protein
LIAGEAAFALLGRGDVYSWAVAIFIEAAAVVAALEIALSYREVEVSTGRRVVGRETVTKRSFNIPAVIVETVTVVCSATYNYTWVSEILTNKSPLQIAAYSVGPLSALTGLGLTIGVTLRKWRLACEAWETARAEAAQAIADQAKAHRAEKEQADREFQRELERQRLEAELKERTRAAKAAERIERMRVKQEAETHTQWVSPLPEDKRKVPETSADLPEWLTVVPETPAEFAGMVAEGVLQLPADITGAQLAAAHPGINTDRTGRNWLKAIKNGKEHHE